RYIQDAREAVKVGDIVKVKVIGVDPKAKRISLSIKALLPKPQRPPLPKKKPAVQMTAQPVQPVVKPALRVVQKAAPAQSRPVKERTTPVPKPVVQPPVQTMAEKIRALQAKFGKP